MNVDPELSMFKDALEPSSSASISHMLELQMCTTMTRYFFYDFYVMFKMTFFFSGLGRQRQVSQALWVGRQPGLHSKFQDIQGSMVREDPALKKKTKKTTFLLQSNTFFFTLLSNTFLSYILFFMEIKLLWIVLKIFLSSWQAIISRSFIEDNFFPTYFKRKTIFRGMILSVGLDPPLLLPWRTTVAAPL